MKHLQENEATRGKHFYTRGSDFSKVNNVLPTDYANKIVCGDSLEVLKQLPDNCVDLIFTSPPYNFGMEYEDTEDVFAWDSYFETLFNVFDQCIRVLKYGGRIAVNVQPVFSDNVPTHHIISQYFMKLGMIWKCEILWEKNHFGANYTAWGSWKSPSSPYFKHTWEFIEVFCKGTLKKEGDAKDADITGDDFKEWTLARWSIVPEKHMDKHGHPAMFPEKLAARVIQLFSFKGDTVLDPFSGAGTTCLVSHKFQRPYLGIDLSPQYCQTAEDRLRLLF